MTQTALKATKRGVEKDILCLLQGIGFVLDFVPDYGPGSGEKRLVLYRGVCPFHDSDARNAFVIYHDGWYCHKGCHRRDGHGMNLGSNLPGLLRHLAFEVAGRTMSIPEARRHINANLGQYIAFVKDNTRKTIGKLSPLAGLPVAATRISYSLDDVLGCVEIPDPYYLSRGYQPETLAHFCVGRCVRPLPNDKEGRLVGWSILPVLGTPENGEHPILGYTARNPRPDKDANKWQHALGFRRGEALYNLHNAIRTSGPLIISEGPGDVMRFHEAGYPGAVATCGGKMTDGQRQLFILFDDCRRKLVVAGDNDERGRSFAAATLAKLQSLRDAKFAPVLVFPEVAKDFGDTSCDEIRRQMDSLGFVATA